MLDPVLTTELPLGMTVFHSRGHERLRAGIEEHHLAEACLLLGEEFFAVVLFLSPLLRKAFTYKKRTKEKIGSEL